MAHKSKKKGYNVCVPQDNEVEMITARDENAELLKVFLLKDEKAAFKEFASNQNKPMYHIARELILEAIKQSKSFKD